MMQPEERQYTLQELADSAGVSIRTIRYYIGEGLLPAPEGAGPQSHYTESHALRLRAISLLKDRYLPLREIRRELAGLDDADVARLISELGGSETQEDHLEAPAAASLPAPAALPRESVFESRPRYDAVDYIDAALQSASPRARPRREHRPESPPEGEPWRRLEVADGVELLVREDRYRRKKDQLSWLIDWARKVID